MMKKMIRISLAIFVVALLSVGGSILYFNLDRPSGMAYASIGEYDQETVRHAILESVREEGFQVVAESEQGDVFEVRSDADQALALNIQVNQQEDYFLISLARPEWAVFQFHSRSQMVEVYGGLLVRVCSKLHGSASPKALTGSDLDRLYESIKELGKSQS